MAEKNIILTGDRPTGRLHIGHYVGSLKRRVELQNSGKFDAINILIADDQALTDNADNPGKIRVSVVQVAREAETGSRKTGQTKISRMKKTTSSRKSRTMTKTRKMMSGKPISPSMTCRAGVTPLISL